MSARDATEVVTTVPERLFGLEPLTFNADGSVTARMPTGPWLSDNEGGRSGLAGALGVLVDDVLGYAINAHAASWSVSTEISIDVVGEVPTNGSIVRAEGRALHRQGTSVYARGRVVDEAGVTIAYAQERGRLIEVGPAAQVDEGISTWRPDVVPMNVAQLFGNEVRLQPDGADVRIGERLANPLGNFHGGMSLCLTEWLATRATPDLLRTSSICMQYVRPLRRGTAGSARVTMEYRGRSLAVLRVVVSDAAGKACTIGSVVREGRAVA